MAVMLLIALILQFFWLPIQLQKARTAFESHIHELLLAGETGIIQNLLERNLGALYSSLGYMQEEYKGRWLNITLYNEDNKQIYPLVEEQSGWKNNKANLMKVIHPLEIEGTSLGYLAFYADWGQEKVNVEKNIYGIRNMIVGMIFLMLVFTTAGQYVLIYKPLRKLGVAINEIKDGNLDTKLPGQTKDEIGDLTKSFRGMLTELEFQKKALDQHAIICMTDSDGVVTYVNSQFVDISGYSRKELVGEKLEIFKPGDDSYGKIWKKIKQGKVWNGEVCIRNKSDDDYWVNATIVPFVNDTGEIERFLSILTDITKQKRAEKQLRYMANHDVLTGLATIRLGKELLVKTLASARREKNKAAVLFIDLDGFKEVNDRYGHDAGDFVLVTIAERFNSCLRENDSIIRIGGDEFLIISNGLTRRDDAVIVAQKVINVLREPIIVNDKKISLGASIGIALYPDHGDDPEALIKYADEAMYTVKRNVKNDYVFYDDITTTV